MKKAIIVISHDINEKQKEELINSLGVTEIETLSLDLKQKFSNVQIETYTRNLNEILEYLKNNVPVFRGGCVLRGQFFDNLVIIPDYEYINEDYIDLKNNILANNNIIAFRENGNILIDDNGAVYFHREAVLGYISANELKGILSKNEIIY